MAQPIRQPVRACCPDGDEVAILGVRFARLRREEALATLEGSFERRAALKIYIANAHTVNLAYSDLLFRDVLNSADLMLNDGTGVQMAGRLAGKPFRDNLVGTDLVPQLCERATQRGVGVYLLGGEPGVAERAAKELCRMAPGLRVRGARHGYFTEEEEAQIAHEINQAGAGILLVAFGNPLQENWIHRNAPRLQCDLCIGVGGLFDHLSGRLRRAPSWMRRIGIEWVHILLNQPHKWRRYLLGNPLFLFRILAERLAGDL